ncbi:SMC-Scp complex subunit ScpB [Algivirga pacifica]|uniref:SMC-Scp complex subunit ScpB n=1 Tax=Algivirga pacifica TaxID=1162670 RepID=A0ABP9D6K9_9BACT
MSTLVKHVEAIIFCAPSSVTVEEIFNALQESLGDMVNVEEINKAIATLIQKYKKGGYAFEIVQSAGGYSFMTKEECNDSVGAFLKNRSNKKLSKSALETLSIIAYKQPISKTELEQIRGVGCDYAVKKLLDKDLVEIKGKSEAIGRPLLYGTSEKFLDYFGINSIKDLPSPKEFREEDLNEIGDVATGEIDINSKKEALPLMEEK